MKFIAAADIHITDEAPVYRKDDYFETCIDKFTQILKITKQEADLLVIAGDFFNSAYVPYEVTRQIASMIKKFGVKILLVPGQHDLRYHKYNLKDTPLGVLVSSRVVALLKHNKVFSFQGVSFIGSGWSKEPTEKADVLVTHRMVTHKGELWPGQTDFQTSDEMLKKYSWAKIIISGDNHIPHFNKTGNRIQVNCGGIMRSTKAQLEHKPRVWLLDSTKMSIEKKFLTIKPYEEVFNLQKIKEDEEKKEQKEEQNEILDENVQYLLEVLQKDKQNKPEFKKVIDAVLTESEYSSDVKELVYDIIETAETKDNDIK